MKKHIALTAAVLASGAIAATSATAADYTMKLGFATFKDVQHQWGIWYKEALEKATNGRIEVKIFPRSQLGAVPRQIDGVRLGTQQGFSGPTDFFSGVDPRFGVFSIPKVFKDKQHAARTLMDPDLNKKIREIGSDKGLETVTVYTHSTAHYFAKNPIRRLSDFKGLKLRVNATPAEREKMRRFGASAVPMPLSEVVPALQRGVIDGTMSGAVIYVIFKFDRIGKVITRTDDTLIISVNTLSKQWLKGLPADLRQTVIDEAGKLQQKTMDYSHENEDFMLKKWAEGGGSLITLPDEDMEKVRTLLADVGEQVTKDNPEVHAFYEHLKEVGKKY